MAKDTYKPGTRHTIEIGGLPALPYINQPRNVEIHKYVTPEIPHKTDILFNDLPKKEQYWRRIQYPEDFFKFVRGITKTNVEQYNVLVDCLQMDIERRKKGLWFMNNGVPTYITGNNYFFLQWGAMINGDVDENGNSYPAYRRFQRDYFYFIDICETDENCLGGFTAKAKKVGVTQMMAAMFVNEATLRENYRLGVMSKTGDECRDTNMSMMAHIVDKMPQIIMPKKGKSNTMEIAFSHPTQKPTGTKEYQEKIQQLKEQKVLNSNIVGKNTKIGAFDGPVYKLLWWDEFSKYYQSVSISPKALFDKDSAAVKLQQKINGKLFITAYSPEKDDQGFHEAKKIYYDSKKITIKHDNILKRTTSNLYCYHISALYATEGTFDIYGEADVQLAFKINQEERDTAKNDHNKLQALIRQGSRHEDESWAVGSGGSVFNNGRLLVSLGEKERMEFMHEPFYKRVDIQWTGPRFRSPLKQINDPNGKWYVTRDLPDGMYNNFMIPEEDNKGLIPGSTISCVGGIDPFDYTDVVDGIKGGSKGASYTIGLPLAAMDSYYNEKQKGDSFSKRIISWYSERPPDPNTFFEDMVKETLFFGKLILIENNKPWLAKKFKEIGMINFLLFQNNETGEIEKYNPNKKQKAKSTQTGDSDEFCRIIDEYLVEPQNGQPDLCYLMEDMGLINQLLIFDPLHTKKFDKVMALAHAIMALNSFSIIQKVKSKPNFAMAELCKALMN